MQGSGTTNDEQNPTPCINIHRMINKVIESIMHRREGINSTTSRKVSDFGNDSDLYDAIRSDIDRLLTARQLQSEMRSIKRPPDILEEIPVCTGTSSFRSNVTNVLHEFNHGRLPTLVDSAWNVYFIIKCHDGSYANVPIVYEHYTKWTICRFPLADPMRMLAFQYPTHGAETGTTYIEVYPNGVISGGDMPTEFD